MSKKTKSPENRIHKLLTKIEHWEERLENEDLHGKTRRRIKRAIYFKRRCIEYLNYLYLLGI